MVGFRLEGVGGISNVSIIVFQHLECSVGSYGPGCEEECECSERETCHYIKGCHIGNILISKIFVQFAGKIFLNRNHFCMRWEITLCKTKRAQKIIKALQFSLRAGVFW